jgi:Ca-activated chloride channel family protein
MTLLLALLSAALAAGTPAKETIAMPESCPWPGHPAAGRVGPQEGPPVFGVEVEVVRVEVLVTRRGEPVRDLSAEDFELHDNGVRQQLHPITFEEAPVDALLVLDLSESVKGSKLDALREAAGAFLGGLSPVDRAALVGFQQSVVVAVPATHAIPSVRFALDTVEGGGSTALHDAVYVALRLPEAGPRRSAVVVFSDGIDNVSWLSGEEVVEAAGRSGAVVYAVDAREPGDPDDDFLKDVTKATGGQVWRAGKTDDLPARFLDVLHDIRARYVLSYTPAGVDTAGWHELEVKLRGRKGDVLARPAYYRPASANSR